SLDLASGSVACGPGRTCPRDMTCGGDGLCYAGTPPVIVDAAVPPDAAVPTNLVFVTSTTHEPASLGGLAGGDAICAARAEAAGLPGTYVAWLSTATVDARDRLGSARGWRRVDGEPFADTVEDLASGKIFYP